MALERCRLRLLVSSRRHARWTAMKTWIALLRGINVVGKHKVPMKELAATLERFQRGSHS
jgi:hypothetical protein